MVITLELLRILVGEERKIIQTMRNWYFKLLTKEILKVVCVCVLVYCGLSVVISKGVLEAAKKLGYVPGKAGAIHSYSGARDCILNTFGRSLNLIINIHIYFKCMLYISYIYTKCN